MANPKRTTNIGVNVGYQPIPFVRSSSIGLMVESVNSINSVRSSSIGLMIESTDSINSIRLSNIGLMIEYCPSRYNGPVIGFV